MSKRERTTNQALIHHNLAQGPTLASERAFHQFKKIGFVCMCTYAHTHTCVYRCSWVYVYTYTYTYIFISSKN